MASAQTDHVAQRSVIDELVTRARDAQRAYERYSQEQVDEVVSAVGWAIVQPEHDIRSTGYRAR